jgi:hypothetical protein
MGGDEIAQAMASVAGVPRQRLRPGAKVSGTDGLVACITKERVTTVLPLTSRTDRS